MHLHLLSPVTPKASSDSEPRPPSPSETEDTLPEIQPEDRWDLEDTQPSVCLATTEAFCEAPTEPDLGVAIDVICEQVLLAIAERVKRVLAMPTTRND